MRIAAPGTCQVGRSAASHRPWNISTLDPISIFSGWAIQSGRCRIETLPNAANWWRRYGARIRPRQTTRLSLSTRQPRQYGGRARVVRGGGVRARRLEAGGAQALAQRVVRREALDPVGQRRGILGVEQQRVLAVAQVLAAAA